MNTSTLFTTLSVGIAICTIGVAPVALARSASAQDRDAISIDRVAPSNGSHATGTANSGPMRLARFSCVSGSVSWRSNASAEWVQATVNTPLQQGSQIESPDGSRAEVQFDDGSCIRLGAGAMATLKTLGSDAEGEFTEVCLKNGAAWMCLTNDQSTYKVTTPASGVTAAGPASLQIGAITGTQVSVFQGAAAVWAGQGESATLRSGEYCDMRDENSRVEVRAIPAENEWVVWNQGMDSENSSAVLADARHMPANIALVAGDLERYGYWRSIAGLGDVWYPNADNSTWRPYHKGGWNQVASIGWTWVSDEAWGWAPYHYGTWVRISGKWGWVPGPAIQYWSPAVVNFYECDGELIWCPLSPFEAAYPATINAGYRRGDWTTRFSILAFERPTTVGHGSRFEKANSVPINARLDGASMIRMGGIGEHGPNDVFRGSEAGRLNSGHRIGTPNTIQESDARKQTRLPDNQAGDSRGGSSREGYNREDTGVGGGGRDETGRYPDPNRTDNDGGGRKQRNTHGDGKSGDTVRPGPTPHPKDASFGGSPKVSEPKGGDESKRNEPGKDKKR